MPAVKILVATSDYPPEIGGMAEYSDAWTRELAAMGHDLRVIVRVGVRQAEGRQPSVPATPVPWSARSYLAPFHAASALNRAYHEFKPDLIMAHTWIGWAPALAWLKGRTGVRYTVAAHGAEIVGPQRSRYYRFLMTQGMRAADRIFPVSAFTAEAVASLGISRERISVIGNGVDLDRFRPGTVAPELVRKYELENRRVILTVGGLVERKGHDTVIRALDSLRNTHPDLTYLIAGGWALNTSNESHLKNLVRELALSDHVVFTGYIPDADLPAIYRLGDVFVLAGREVKSRGWVEGFGISLLEAAASGLPIVTTAAGGALDAVTASNAIIVSEDDPGATADAIARVVDDPPLRDKMSMEGMKWTCNKTWKSRVAEAMPSIEEILRWR